MEWTKVSQALPTNNGIYLVTLKRKDDPYLFTTSCYWENRRWLTNRIIEECFGSVIEWMPMEEKNIVEEFDEVMSNIPIEELDKLNTKEELVSIKDRLPLQNPLNSVKNSIKKDLLETLGHMNRRFESLPYYAKDRPITERDLYAFTSLLEAIFSVE